MTSRLLKDLEAEENGISPIGAPLGTILNRLADLRSMLLLMGSLTGTTGILQ